MLMTASVLRFSCLHVGRENHVLDAFSEIPAFDDIVALFFISDDDIFKAGFIEHSFQFLHGNCAGDSAAVSFFILLYSFGEVTLLQDI